MTMPAAPRTILQGGFLTEQIANDKHAVTSAGLLTGSWQGVDDQILQGVDETAASADFVILTNPRGSKQNRNGNIVDITPTKDGQGMSLANYQQNPVVLWDHGFGHPFPIGTSQDPNGQLSLKLQKTKATATVYFDQGSEFAMDVFRMVAQKIIRMSSVGFRALKAFRLKAGDPTNEGSAIIDMEATRRFWQIVESELMEWSVVNIGADRGALRQALDCGKVGGEKLAWATQTLLKPHAEDAPAIGIGLPDFVQQAVDSAVAAGVDADLLWQTIGEQVQAAETAIVEGTSESDEEPVGIIQTAEDGTIEPIDETQGAETDENQTPGETTTQAAEIPLEQLPADPEAAAPMPADEFAQQLGDQIEQRLAPQPDPFETAMQQAVEGCVQASVAVFEQRCQQISDQIDYLLTGRKSSK